jgi:hypothetical protein
MTRKMAAVPAAAGAAGAFSDLEEEFFRDGLRLEAQLETESWDDLDAGYEPPRFWDRLVGRRQQRAATEPPLPIAGPPKRASTARIVPVIATDEDEEWEWQLAMARARAANDAG